MLLVGLTGGIGAGKSAVARLLQEQGCDLVDADVLAREVVAPGTPGLDALVTTFGADILAPDGSLDRPRLGERVFGDDAARATLNGIVHPLIGARTLDLLAASTADVLVHDVPLLVEAGYGPGYHLVLVVDAPTQTRLERLHERGLPRAQALARMAAQADEPARRAAADVWLDNGGTPADLARTVTALHETRLAPYADNLRAARPAPRGPVALVPPDPAWAAQGARLVARLRHVVPTAVRVEHLGSTSVPGLRAKDVVDLQVELATWQEVEQLAAPLLAAGFPRLAHIDGDPPRPEVDPDPAVWRKRLHQGADPGRAVNVHVRVAGSAGAALAVCFRDRLRADPVRREAYATCKADLAARYSGDVDAYAEAKTRFILDTCSGHEADW